MFVYLLCYIFLCCISLLICYYTHLPIYSFLTGHYYTMSAVTNTYEKVKAVILSAHKNSTTEEKINFYNSWAQNYDQVWQIYVHYVHFVYVRKNAEICCHGCLGCGCPGLPCTVHGSKQHFVTL